MTQQSSSGGRPAGWQKEHMRRYIETNGEDGHIWNGVPTLLLTTIGRKSGHTFTTPLIYGESHGQYLVIGSRGGAPEHPQWYQNLAANPDVEVQVLGDRFKARARTASDDEKAPLWDLMVSIYPSFAEYQTRTERAIPVVILERV
ncbi:MAG: nitroreductase family deazaflavin-dependent oxidoreductase [Chloroflexota bacterium]